MYYFGFTHMLYMLLLINFVFLMLYKQYIMLAHPILHFWQLLKLNVFLVTV